MFCLFVDWLRFVVWCFGFGLVCWMLSVLLVAIRCLSRAHAMFVYLLLVMCWFAMYGLCYVVVRVFRVCFVLIVVLSYGC